MILYCLTSVLLPVLAGNEEPFSKSIREIRGMDERDAAKVVWQSILDNGLKLGPALRPGFFEVFSTHSLSTRRAGTDRHFFDFDGRVASALYITVRNLPGGALIGDDNVLLTDKGGWARGPVRTWRYDAVGPGIERPLKFAEPADEGGIHFDAGSCLRHAIGKEPLSLDWSRATGTLVARKGDGAVASVTLRTPNDQQTFGTIVGDLTLRSAADRWISHRSFIVDVASPLRPDLPDMDELCRLLGASDRRNSAGTVSVLREYTDEAATSANALHRAVGQLACIDKRPVTDPRFPTLFYENLQYLNGVAVQHYEPAVNAGRRFAKRDEFAEGLAYELEIAARSVETALVTENGLVDDPNLLWLGFERAFFSPNADFLYSSPARLVLSSRDTSSALKTRVAVAMADMGAPCWSSIQDVPFDIPGRDADLLRAIFHARWNRPASTEEVEVCRSTVTDDFAGLDAKAAAIDCLLRWGNFRDVSAEEADTWFRFRLKGGPSTRHSMIKALSRQPDGRAFLQNRMEDLRNDPNIFRQVSSMMRQRATATLAMSRFDFMSAEECREILAKWQ